MDNCNSGDHIAEDNIHTDIATCNIKEQQQKYRLRTVRNRLRGRGRGSVGGWGVGGKHVLLDQTSPFASVTVLLNAFNRPKKII